MPSRESSRAFTVRPSQKEALREAKTAANQDQETNKDMCKRVRFRVQLAASTPKLRRLLLEDLAKALGVETTRLRVEEIRSAKGNSRRRAALKFPDTERKREASRGSLLAAGFKTKCIITSCISGCYVHRAKREGEDRNTAIRVYIKPVKTPNLEAKLQKECEILLGHSRRCPPHPCIIRLISRMDLRGTTFMITPLMSTRSLQDRLEETDIMGEDVCVCVTVQMALALTHLHSHGVAHGELVPRHILFETEDNFSRAKLTGLGTCELFEAQTETRHSRDGYDADVVSEGTRNLKKADVYALGGLSYRILTGKMPSVKKHGPVNAAIYWGLRMPVSSSAKHAVGNMLESVPGFRRSAPEVLESPWLKSASPAIKALVTMAIDVRDRGIVTGDEWALMKPHLPESCIKSIEKELKAKGELPLATCLKSAVLSREKPKDDTDSNARKYASDSSFLASISASKATGDVAH
uniref:Protein kinase domain-containing protein n=1 Tax=Lotharella globosa TaxID=91324 RepID=A0A7S3Z2P2_9EUKA